MVPFEKSWPYEAQAGEIIFQTCPFCQAESVHLGIDREELASVRTGSKKLVVLRCCYETIKLVDADDDYVLSDRKLRQKGASL